MAIIINYYFLDQTYIIFRNYIGQFAHIFIFLQKLRSNNFLNLRKLFTLVNKVYFILLVFNLLFVWYNV